MNNNNSNNNNNNNSSIAKRLTACTRTLKALNDEYQVARYRTHAH